MSLPHIMLTDSQAHLLAELIVAPLPVREGSDVDAEVGEEDIATRGLDHETTLVDLPRLVFLGLVVRETDVARVTDLGMAVHYERQLSVVQGRLGDVVRFASAVEGSHPRLVQTLRLLANGDITLWAAVTEAASPKPSG
ncbi:hypothetical protein ACWDQL_13300 [Streptomyces olivaceus]|uniref:hypothetical protein n=1 Tax=Streptomyces olivaceus TaxID=47716 RepID=UPI001CCADBDD|nr:hypothetical protein [Streptomyces olivaceus]MBZ6226114.1 hypothetical protein [Streptomyces olivaceus]